VSADRAASVLARLLNRSRSTGENYNLLLSRFVVERLLYRLSVSPHAGSFVLKGALLFPLWYDTPHRPTKDADLLGFGADDADTLRATFTAVCAIDASRRSGRTTFTVGRGCPCWGFVASARLPVKVDIGFGDAITPAPDLVAYPTLLDGMDAPHLRAYPVYTVIAEKFHAMVELGINNSRMKDFFDLAVIATTSALEGCILVEALRATFARRSTALPASTPIALTSEFAADPAKLRQWGAFKRKAQLQAQDLTEVILLLDALLSPPIRAAVNHESFHSNRSPAVRR
jgi:Nucleotidyl transferase AbiEii toxin, Type IV TA system